MLQSNQLFSHCLGSDFVIIWLKLRMEQDWMSQKMDSGVCQDRERFDVRAFNPQAPPLKDSPLSSCYIRNEQDKKHAYDEKICKVEFGCFSFLIFSTAGGKGPVSTTVFKRIAMLPSEKREQSY